MRSNFHGGRLHRAPFPPGVFSLLLELMADIPLRTVLDLGCGCGEIARELVPIVDRVDAIDFSAAMVSAGQRLPSGLTVSPGHVAPMIRMFRRTCLTRVYECYG